MPKDYITNNAVRFGKLWIENAGILPNIIASAIKNRYTGSFPICILGRLYDNGDKKVNISFAQIMFKDGVITGIHSHKLHKQHKNDFHSFVNYLQNGVDSEILIVYHDNLQNIGEYNNPALMITKYYFALHNQRWTDLELCNYLKIPYGNMQGLIQKCEELINYDTKTRFDIVGNNNSELSVIFQNFFDGPPPIKFPLDFPELSCIRNFGKILPFGTNGQFSFYTHNSIVNNIDENLPFGRIDIMRNIQKCVTDPKKCRLIHSNATEPIFKDCSINEEEEKIKKFYGFATNKDLYSAQLFIRQLGISNDEWELMDEINNLFHNGELQHESVVAFLDSKGVEEIKELEQKILHFAKKMKDKGVPVVDPLINQLLGRINALPPPQPEQVNDEEPIEELNDNQESIRELIPEEIDGESIEKLNDNQESSLKSIPEEIDGESIEKLNDNQESSLKSVPEEIDGESIEELIPEYMYEEQERRSGSELQEDEINEEQERRSGSELQEEDNDEEQEENQPPPLPPEPVLPPEPPLLPQGRMKIPPQPAIPDAPRLPAERVLEQWESDGEQDMGSGSELQEEDSDEEQDEGQPQIPEGPPPAIPPEPPLPDAQPQPEQVNFQIPAAIEVQRDPHLVEPLEPIRESEEDILIPEYMYDEEQESGSGSELVPEDSDEEQERGSGSESEEDILIPEYMYEEQDEEQPAIPPAPLPPPAPPLRPQGRMKIPPQPAIPPAPPLPPEPPLPPQERIKIPPQPAIPPEPPPKRELKPVRSIGNIPKSNPELLKNPPYQKPSSDTDINIEESKPININIEDDRMDSLSNQNFDTEDVQPNVSNNLQPITNQDNSQQQYNLKFLKHNIVKRSSNIGFSDIYLSIIISSLLILFGILGLLLIPASVVRNAVMATIITVGFVGTMFTAATVYYNRKANQSKIQKNARYDNQQKTQSLTVSQKSLNERNLINHPRHRNGFSSERQLN